MWVTVSWKAICAFMGTMNNEHSNESKICNNARFCCILNKKHSCTLA